MLAEYLARQGDYEAMMRLGRRLEYLDYLDKKWKSYVEHQSHNGESSGDIKNSYNIYTQMLRSNGLPSINELLYRDSSRIPSALDELLNKPQWDEAADGSVMNIPLWESEKVENVA